MPIGLPANLREQQLGLKRWVWLYNINIYLHFYHICALRCHRQQLSWFQSPWYRQNYFPENSSNSTWRVWKSQLKFIHVFLYPIIKMMRSAQIRAFISQFAIDVINICHKCEIIIELFERFHGWSILWFDTLCVWIIHLGRFLRVEWATLRHSIAHTFNFLVT